jgi:hypothetical protein
MGAAVALGHGVPRLAAAAGTTQPGRWHDPRSWPSGRVPGPADRVVIDREIVIDERAEAGSVEITRAGRLVFAPGASATLVTRGNVVVAGALVMRPATPAVVHTLRFEGVDEGKYVGGGMSVLPSDVGLWVVDGGALDAVGAAKRPWTRATASLAAGQRVVKVQDSSGWRPGDVVAIAPTGQPSLDNGKQNQDVNHCLTYDEAVVVRVDGTTVTLDRPLRFSHPQVVMPRWDGRVAAFGAEVLNLTRNVVIQGDVGRRAHVMFLHCMRPQRVAYVELRHLAPRKLQRQADGLARTEGVLGRYALHFHHCGDGSRSTVVEGVVAHRCGGHAFVPHESHGVTFRDCVAHDVRDSPFWYDLDGEATTSHDGVWERCVASKVWTEKGAAEGYRMSGFVLAEGRDGSNSCIDCVAVGVYSTQGVTMSSSAASGFHWSGRAKSVWRFAGCLAHNIGGSGILAWQNTEAVHVIETFSAYHCGKAGVDHGAYSNFWQYRDLALFANRRAGLAIHAVTRRTGHTPPGAPPLRFTNVVVDGGGITRWGIQSEGHRFAAGQTPTVLVRPRVTRCRDASFYEPAIQNRSYLRFENPQMHPREFLVADGASRDTVLEVNGVSGTFRLVPKAATGTPVPAWNARRA